MTAHTVAAAQCFTFQCFVWLFVYVLFFVLCTSCWANNIYSRHDLLKIRAECYSRVSPLTQHSSGYSKEPRLSMDYQPRGEEAKAAL